MATMQGDAAGDDKIGQRMRRLVDRTIQRNIKGVGYFASAAPPVGLTPKETIYKRGTLNLYHYHPLSEEIYRVPVLIVMATTNRAYVLDLAPGNSFVEFLLKAGYDVFVMDWDAPRPEESALRLEDYSQTFISECVEQVQQVTGEKEFTLMGYCMGGVLSVIHTATNMSPSIANLVCFTTPINWHEMGLFAHWSNKKHFDVDRLVDAVGNIPADLLMTSFDMLRPANRAPAAVAAHPRPCPAGRYRAPCPARGAVATAISCRTAAARPAQRRLDRIRRYTLATRRLHRRRGRGHTRVRRPSGLADRSPAGYLRAIQPASRPAHLTSSEEE